MTVLACPTSLGAEPTTISVDVSKPRQEFQGMGCGSIFYTGHITSFAKRGKRTLQRQFYDDIFTAVPTRYLHLMIRPDHEPQNDNDDPYRPDFSAKAFGSTAPTIELCKAAKARRRDMQLYATLYTPPSWMKTNGKPSGGGKEKATLKDGLELELAEFMWAYLQHMRRAGHPIHYLSICNEPDWPHSQPSYFLTPERHAELFAIVADYLEKMHRRFPFVPKPKLVAPNVLSAVNAAKRYLPATLQTAGRHVDIVAAHDYDRRGQRWKTLRELAGNRPLWCSEWCWNGKDTSPDLINSASEFWLVMTEAFNQGVNVWMAYDWAYPPRQGGEALTHIEWGKSYHKTRIYHGFSQWCRHLQPGMRVVETTVSGPGATGIATPGVKASAFVARDRRHVVVHVVNLQDKPADIKLQAAGRTFDRARVRITRTSRDEAQATQPPRRLTAGEMADALKPREMVTYVVAR
jgi:O-glycosyl hydrolase